MPEPTTRRGRFLHRREKYRRRAKRKWHAGSVDVNNHVAGTPWRKFPVYSCGETGALQMPAVLVGYHPSTNPVPFVFYVPSTYYTLVHAERRVPPRCFWNFNSEYNGNGNHHMSACFIGVHRRRVKYRGHKVGRHDGFNWLAARARQWYFQYGGEGYPSWDPLHRTPVFDG